MQSPNYLDPESELTLAQAVAELRRAEEPGDDASETLAPELAGDIDIHDAIHAMFGCTTDLRGEILAHVWTLFGTTTSARAMVRVNLHRDHREVLTKIGHRKLLGTWLRNLPRILGTALRAARMTRRWPADRFEEDLDRRLVELRREYGVRLTRHAPGGARPSGAGLRRVALSRSVGPA
ncbi:MAG: hypothetical protein AAF682_00260 [Planctomycetota bacterium]